VVKSFKTLAPGDRKCQPNYPNYFSHLNSYSKSRGKMKSCSTVGHSINNTEP
jgi:hypothetical protein